VLSEKKRIILISRQSGLGGTERRMTDLGEYLSLNNHDVRLFFTTSSQVKGIFSRIKNSPLGRFLRIVSLLNKFNPHLINAFDIETGIYVSVAKWLLFKKTILISGYGAEAITDKRTQKILRKSLFLADLYICNSRKASENLQTYIGTKRKVITIRNGLDVARLNKSIPVESEISAICKDKFVVGYIGKLDNIKHGERVFYLAQRMLQNNTKYSKPLHFIIIGDGPNKESTISSLNHSSESVRNAVTIMGAVKDAGVLAKYFNIGILCSNSEGFPNVLLEYMYFGVAWMSTNVGDVQEIIKFGKSGIIEDKWDEQLFEKNCIDLMNNDEKLEELSSIGKKVFIENYTIEKMGESYLEVYKSLLN
jgi:glycosyltransferase involved in cell wall biosynthesis